jgi:ATP-dependent helicase/nuclease subunit B
LLVFQVIHNPITCGFPSTVKLFSTSCETLYLGWRAPLLPAAVTTLTDRFAKGHRLDLSSLICVLPSTRSSRQLESLLRSGAEARDLHYDAPQIITVGQLAERLYQPGAPTASEFEQTLCWTRVLRAKHPEDLAPLIPTVPAAEPIGPWMELAGALRRLHEELAANRLIFSDVIEVAETDSEKRRWKLLSRLFGDYQKALGEAGLSDPHWGRRQAVRLDRCHTDRTVVLIGTSDLSESLVAMLRSLDSDLISLVAAPPSEASRFDEFGCVETGSWIDHHIPLDDDHLIGAGDISDQATAVAESVARFAPQYSADQVTVGVTDESYVGPVSVELRGCGVSTYRHLGWTIPQTSVGRLLDLTVTYLHRRSWRALGALVRHADVCAMISRSLGDVASSLWMTQLDKMLAEHFPTSVRAPLPSKAIDDFPLASRVGELVEQWLDVFSGADQPIARWSEVIQRWLDELYDAGAEDAGAAGVGVADPDSPAIDERPTRTAMALKAAQRIVERFSKLNDQLDLTVAGGAAMELLAGRLADVRVVESPRSDDIHILGWLDLALDHAPALVVVGLNHPFVPAAVTSDPFLPGQLRTRLRMADNDRRYARDVYAMHILLSSRSDVRFIVGRTGADRSPTPPSRLLAATPAADAARRVRTLLGPPRESTPVHHRWDQGPQSGLLPIPKLTPLSEDNAIKTLSVTAFRDYLACPYRFYLRHVLKLKPLDDASSEMAANQFGNLIHASLERFGESSDRNETDRSKIEASLFQHLHDYAGEHYGDAVSTAVTLQIAQAERRLKAVAKSQAERIADGWIIHASEASVDEKTGAGIDIDGIRIGLRGRFDRIDHHAESGRWAILDYKTHGHLPEKKHLQKTDDGYRWVDLQLPLYRMLIPYLGIDAPPTEVELGYFNVSEKDEETGINIADFSEPLIHQAEELIHECVRRIRLNDFEPTSERVQFDDYGMILQTGVASRLLDRTELYLGEEVEA